MMPPYDMPASEGEPPKEGEKIISGEPLPPGTKVASEDSIVEAMRTVFAKRA